MLYCHGLSGICPRFKAVVLLILAWTRVRTVVAMAVMVAVVKGLELGLGLGQ